MRLSTTQPLVPSGRVTGALVEIGRGVAANVESYSQFRIAFCWVC